MRIRAVVLSIVLLAAPIAAEAAYTVVCRVPMGTAIRDISISLDPAASTANGVAAVFSDAEIRWDEDYPDRKLQLHYNLNRYTGLLALTSKSEGNVLNLTGTCEAATTRKF